MCLCDFIDNFRIMIKNTRLYHFGKNYVFLKNVLKMLVSYSVTVVGATLARINYVYIYILVQL
jgi:hypothetical protein